MRYLTVNYSKGQMKIQQMAFILVAIIIFFSMVALFYLSIRVNSLRGDAEQLRGDEIRETVRKLSASPELSWSVTDCSSCIDFDKALVLKENVEYRDFWDVAFLQIEKIYPEVEGECSRQNYPECKSITFLDEGDYITYSTFVSICRYDSIENFNKCEFGRIIAGFEPVN